MLKRGWGRERIKKKKSGNIRRAEVEAGRHLEVQGQPGLYNEFHDSQGFIESQRKTTTKKTRADLQSTLAYTHNPNTLETGVGGF